MVVKAKANERSKPSMVKKA